MEPAKILENFTKSREKAYLFSKSMTGQKARAISRIQFKAEWIKKKNLEVQLKTVLQLETEIMCLLPSEKSRFTGIRIGILKLLEIAKQKINVPHPHSTDHEGSPHPQGKHPITFQGIKSFKGQ